MPGHQELAHTPGKPGREVGPGPRVKCGHRWSSGVCSCSRSGWGLPKRGHRTPPLQWRGAPSSRPPRPAVSVSGCGKQWSPTHWRLTEAGAQEVLVGRSSRTASWVSPRGDLTEDTCVQARSAGCQGAAARSQPAVCLRKGGPQSLPASVTNP